jgi:two-component system phosphate regulon sensor histidine kinase PhoR
MEPVAQNVRLVQRAYWLIKLRWIAIVCVGIGIYFSSDVLAIELQVLALYGITVLLALYNMAVWGLLNHITRTNREVSVLVVKRIINFQICADLVLLTAILHFSGGVENPFAFYFIFHMIIASILLSMRESYLQATLAVLLFGLLLLSEYFQLIPHHCLKGFVEHCLHREGVYVLGTFFVFATSLYLVVYMTSYIAIRLRRAEQALRASGDYLGRILNGMHEGLVVVDRNFEIKDVNGRFLEQCGVARDEAVGSKCYRISHHTDKPCSGPEYICPAIQVFNTAETVQVEHTHFDSATNPHFVELNAFPLLATDGNVEAVVELSHDITERKRAEQTLKEANILLQEKDRIKDEYVFRVTHDIKGHLATIQSCLAIIVDGVSGKREVQEMDLVRRAYRRTLKLSDFVRTLLKLTKLRLDHTLEIDDFSLVEAFQNTIENVKNRAEDKSITLNSKIESSVGRLYGNQFSIEEMVMNLLLNAIKYTPENGTVELKASGQEDSVLIEISDTGIGIPQEEQHKIFDEFFRATNARKVEWDGTGLGLSIVKHIVEGHGGEISVKSSEGSGTTFIIQLPRMPMSQLDDVSENT